MSDMFDILDKSIDDIADLPSFAVPDTGVYGLRITMEAKAINDKPTVVAHFEVRHVVELADSSIPEESRAKAGDKFDRAYFLKTNDGAESDFGLSSLKEFVLPFESLAGTKNLREIVQFLATPVDITAKVVKRQRKDDKEKFEARVSDITID
jgi:hypothetical protein